MTFWSEREKIIEPVRPYRFRIMDAGVDLSAAGADSGYWWWAKSVTKPSFEISKEEYQLINHKFKYPGILTWKDVSIKIIDYKDDNNMAGPTKIHGLYSFIENSRYSFTNQEDGISKDKLIKNFIIEQLDADGSTMEKWTLVNAFITSIDNTELSYESETLSEITINVSYDTAELTT
jgi:hypothetical protein|tara:strand:+ start:109 stop:639 length:531 start_codon:yes stop_codon:yes gene_type:complete